MKRDRFTNKTVDRLNKKPKIGRFGMKGHRQLVANTIMTMLRLRQLRDQLNKPKISYTLRVVVVFV